MKIPTYTNKKTPKDFHVVTVNHIPILVSDHQPEMIRFRFEEDNWRKAHYYILRKENGSWNLYKANHSINNPRIKKIARIVRQMLGKEYF